MKSLFSTVLFLHIFLLSSLDANAQAQVDTNMCIVGNDTLRFAVHHQDESCVSGCNGLYFFEPLIGSGNYSYLVTSGSYNSTTIEDSFICDANYLYTVTDLVSGVSCSGSFLINQVIPINWTLTRSNYGGYQISGPGMCDGTASLTITGGVPPYYVTWYNYLMVPIGMGTSITGLCAGNYFYRVVDSSLPCCPTCPPGGPGGGGGGAVGFTMTAAPAWISASSTIWWPACGLEYTTPTSVQWKQGSVYVNSVTGNVPPWQIWTNGGWMPYTGPGIYFYPTCQNFPWTQEGVTVKDASGYSDFFQGSMDPFAYEKCYAPGIVVASTNGCGSCGGSIAITAVNFGHGLGSTGFPWTVKLYTSPGGVLIGTQVLNALNQTTTFPNLCNGGYTITATNSAGCPAYPGFKSIANYNLPTLSNAPPTLSCSPCANSINLTAAGGTPTYQFSVNAGTTYQASGNFSNLCAGTYTAQVRDFRGCTDTNVIVIPVTTSPAIIESQTHCNSYMWPQNATTYTSSGTYYDTLTNVYGCDSVRGLNLTIATSTTGTDVQNACDSYTWINGTTYTADNNSATWLLTNAQGCDSLVTLDLSMTYSSSGTDVQSACDSYTWMDGNTYTSSNNTATWVLSNAIGCDSIVTLDLMVTNSSAVTDVQSACDSYTWMDGNTYTASNNSATWLLTNAVGCDSLVTLDLLITNSTTGIDTKWGCDSYTWIDGNTYTSTTTSPTWLLSNSAGCDSVVSLNLTIAYTTAGTDIQTACDSYTWIDGNTYTASNNSATWMLTNSTGCDSMVTLNLSITNSTTGTEVQTACDSYTWIDGNTYTASNNSATWMLTNAAGCDSIVTLDLAISNSNSGTDVQTACNSYTWIDGNTYTSNNNSATWTLTNTAGCDSVVTLDLVITNFSSGTDIQTACDSYTWIDGNTYTASNNSATWTLTNAAGCDSTVTLNLTVNTVNSGITPIDLVSLTANTAGAQYQWVDCNDNYSAIIGQTGQTFAATQNGSYAVIVTENGCADTSACLIINSVALFENGFGEDLKIYPNPTSGDLIIDLGDTYANISMRLYTMSGQLLKEEHIQSGQMIETSIDRAPGSYRLEIFVQDERKAVVRVVKE